MPALPSRAKYLGGSDAELREVPGFDGQYSVTQDGRVWSRAREWVNGKGAPQSHDGMWLKPILDKTGYLRVRISLGQRRHFPSVHRLVAMAWIPNPMALPQVNHIDGHKLNNRAENLEWCTQADNNRHAYAIGLNGPNPKRKLSDDAARSLRVRHANGETVTALARELLIDRKTVYGVLKGRTYRG
ncbi:HNH endonuclease [Piscinibacter defluvii]|uniref:HNH endonuclease n=1 Tax=Piscinibacter defluvii TaxID=1796922 RepID=UPI000FDEFA9A|nr:NUMOD4 domain-containing protein [Piscinibacter defluvii]